MVKYYVVLLLAAAAALFYVFQNDPCTKNMRADFSRQYPEYKILDSGSREGSPEEVQCHLSYQKPDSDQVYEDTWLYRNTESGWLFSSALTKEKAVPAP